MQFLLNQPAVSFLVSLIFGFFLTLLIYCFGIGFRFPVRLASFLLEKARELQSSAHLLPTTYLRREHHAHIGAIESTENWNSGPLGDLVASPPPSCAAAGAPLPWPERCGREASEGSLCRSLPAGRSGRGWPRSRGPCPRAGPCLRSPASAPR